MAITTFLMIKRVFNLPLRALQGFVDSIFEQMALPLRCPDYSLISKRAKRVNISIKTPTRGEISHLVIDSTGLKVFGKGNEKSGSTGLTGAESGASFISPQTVRHMKLSVQIHRSAVRQMLRHCRG